MSESYNRDMQMRLDLERAIQAAGVLLDQRPSGRMGYLRLLKLLYIANRESIRRFGRPVVPDRYVAMEHGPVLSRVYDLIKGESPIGKEQWDRHFRRVGYELELLDRPGIGQLARADIEILHDVLHRYSDIDDWDIVNETHEFEEWKRNDPGKSSRDIPLEQIFEAVDRDGAMAEDLLAEERKHERLRRLFRGESVP